MAAVSAGREGEGIGLTGIAGHGVGVVAVGRTGADVVRRGYVAHQLAEVSCFYDITVVAPHDVVRFARVPGQFAAISSSWPGPS